MGEIDRLHVTSVVIGLQLAMANLNILNAECCANC